MEEAARHGAVEFGRLPRIGGRDRAPVAGADPLDDALVENRVVWFPELQKETPFHGYAGPGEGAERVHRGEARRCIHVLLSAVVRAEEKLQIGGAASAAEPADCGGPHVSIAMRELLDEQ